MESNYHAFLEPVPSETLPHPSPLPLPPLPPPPPPPPTSSVTSSSSSSCLSYVHLALSLVSFITLVLIQAVPAIVQVDYTDRLEVAFFGSLRVGLWQWCSSPSWSSLPPQPSNVSYSNSSASGDHPPYSCQSYSSADVEMLYPGHSSMFNCCRAILLLSSMAIGAVVVIHVLHLTRLLSRPQHKARFSLTLLSVIFSFISMGLVGPLTPPLQEAETALFAYYCPDRSRDGPGCRYYAGMTDWARGSTTAGLFLGLGVLGLHSSMLFTLWLHTRQRQLQLAIQQLRLQAVEVEDRAHAYRRSVMQAS